MRRGIFFFSFLLLASCAGRATWKKSYDFSSIRKVAVAKFDAPEDYPSAGAAARDFFTMALVNSGVNIVDTKVFDKLISQASPVTPEMWAHIGSLAGADAILDGTILNYVPEKEDRIFYATEDGNIGYETSFYNAKVAISARLIDVDTGEVVWLSSDSYESFEILHALEGASYTVVRPLVALLNK